MKLEEIVALSVKHNVSDLHLCNSAAPRWRRQGRLEPAPFPAPDIANLLNDWLDAAQLLHWQEHGQIDFALTLACGARLRASAFAHTRGISLVLRLLPVQCPRLETLGAPPALSAGSRGQRQRRLTAGAGPGVLDRLGRRGDARQAGPVCRTA